MIKVCVFIDWFIPGYKAGGPVKSLALLIDKLSKTEHFEFYVICRNTDYMDTKPYPDVISDSWNLVSPFLKIYYISEFNCSLSNYKKIITPIKPNILYINGIWSYKFSILPLFLKSGSIVKRIVSPRGMLNSSAISIKSGKKKSFLFAARILNLYKNTVFHFTNSDEHIEAIKVLAKIKKYAVISNFSADYPPNNKRPEKAENALSLLFIGRISPEKNLHFALECLSEIYSCQITFDIFGEIYNKVYWAECNEVMNKLPANITVNYFGFIKPNELKLRLNNYHYLFLPTLGENFGHAISESMQAGIPVIISNKTPWNHIADTNAGFVIDLNKKETFIQTLKQVASENNETYLNRVGEVQKFVNEFINSTNLLETYIKLFSV